MHSDNYDQDDRGKLLAEAIECVTQMTDEQLALAVAAMYSATSLKSC